MTRAWQKAASYAATAHKDQTRSDEETPYFAHPCRVALTLLLIFGSRDETALAAALLHDTIEDTHADFDEIEEEFGREVARLVGALTKNKALPRPRREPEYDGRLANGGWRAALVKLADCYDNLTDSEGPAKVRSSAAKCRRAIAIAKPHAAHADIARGIAALRALIARRTRGRRS